MTEAERWSLLRESVRIRWCKMEVRLEDTANMENKVLLKMGIATYKDVLRIINQIEGLGR